MNYGQLKAAVQSYLEANETTFNTYFPQFVRNCEEEVFRQVQLPDLMQTATANFITGNPIMPVPNDFLSPYSLAVIVNGEYQFMTSKDHSFIRETYSDPTAVGVPRFYAIFDGANLLIGPTPGDDFQVELNYFYEPVSLAEGENDSATSWLSINAENVMLFGTILQGYTFLKGDENIIAQYTEKYQTALAALKIIAEGRNRKDSYRKADRRIGV